MLIHQNFTGGNITFERVEGDVVYIERQIRDTEGDWFYWAFCAEGCAGRTLTFLFPSTRRVGKFGAAVSHDLKNWHWSDSGSEDRFTYTFAEDEDKVYFAHDMVYLPDRFERFCAGHGLQTETFCKSFRGRDLPALRFGSGDKWILMTSRHHACESPGSYMLEGSTEVLIDHLPEGYSVLAIPYVDYDGVLDGDQGKSRLPHDHNRDYIDEPIYEVIRKIKEFSLTHDVRYVFDLHAPWHTGEEHDHVYLLHGRGRMAEPVFRFSDILKKESAGLELNYTGERDIDINSKWNGYPGGPSCRGYFCTVPSVELCLATETTYSGRPEAKVSQEALLNMGRAFGRSIVSYIESKDA